jgi:hypothetical protein
MVVMVQAAHLELLEVMAQAEAVALMVQAEVVV